jgi:hypothetical protein
MIIKFFIKNKNILVFIFLFIAVGYLSFDKYFNKPMLDHFSFAIKDFDKNSVFYDETLKILGYKRTMSLNLENDVKLFAYGPNFKPIFWISNKGFIDSEEIGNSKGQHIAFIAHSVEEVNNWHKKCLALGGKNNGAPGPRPEYHKGYYGAFIIDPSGWRIEACIHNYKG